MTNEDTPNYQIVVDASLAERMVALGLLEQFTSHRFTEKGMAWIDSLNERETAKQPSESMYDLVADEPPLGPLDEGKSVEQQNGAL